MGAAARSHAKKELLLVKRLHSGARRVFNPGRTAWRASLARPQSRRDHRKKNIFVARKRGRSPKPSAGRSRAALPAFQRTWEHLTAAASLQQQTPELCQAPCPSCPRPGTGAALRGRAGAGQCSREAPRVCRHPVPSSHLLPARTLQRPCCRNTSIFAPMPHAEPVRLLTARGSAALPWHTGPWARATAPAHPERHGWSRAPFHLHPTLLVFVQLL